MKHECPERDLKLWPPAFGFYQRSKIAYNVSGVYAVKKATLNYD